MAVAYQSTTGFAEGNSTSIAGIAKPASTAIGDLLVAQLYMESTTLTPVIASTGDTWVPVRGDVVNATSNPDLHLFCWICIVANASSTIGVTWGGGAFWRDFAVHRVTGHDTTTPEDVTATDNTGTSVNETGTGLASGTAGRLLMLLTANFAGNTRASWTSPLTEQHEGGNLAMACGEDVAGTDTASKSNTITSTNWATIMLAIRPAATLSREQEGFRFRADDGDEDAATWLDAQDTDVTRAKQLNTRLRILTNVTVDAPSEALKLQYRKAGASEWHDIGE